MNDIQKVFPPSKIDHIGIAVHSIEKALSFYIELLGLSLEKIESVPSEGVKVAFLKIGETRIELLEPLHKESSIYTYLQKNGEGIHHIALETKNMESQLEQLMKNGVKVIPKTPKKGANNKQISFIHPHSTHGVLYELCSKIY